MAETRSAFPARRSECLSLGLTGWSAPQVVLAVAACGAAVAGPMTKGYSYPVPDNGLYLPPPPDKGGPVNPGGSENTEITYELPKPTTTRAPYVPPSTTRRPLTRRPVTTQRPTYRPVTTQPTYRPVAPPKPEYIPPNLIPDGSGPPGGRVPFPTTTRRPVTRPRPRPTTTRRPVTRPRPRPTTTTPAPAAGSKMMHMSRPYEFGYDVDDSNTDNAFSQKETSDGMVITGEYRWLMPDGRTQIVEYLADWAKGYYATVRYE